jgi:hypothetical protein
MEYWDDRFNAIYRPGDSEGELPHWAPHYGYGDPIFDALGQEGYEYESESSDADDGWDRDF